MEFWSFELSQQVNILDIDFDIHLVASDALEQLLLILKLDVIKAVPIVLGAS